MNIEEIIAQCTTWAKENLSPDFEFRKYQLESIVAIITRVLDGVKTQTMNAPTGSGKSLTAIIAAGVLHEYYKKTSYILVSDLSLFAQYEADLERYNLPWGHLKGKDNYVCMRNGNVVGCGECALNMVSVSQLSTKEDAYRRGYGCATKCEYVKMRNLAMKAPVTVMTYQLYLIQRNYVADLMDSKNEDVPFPARDLVICDEAHKLNDIIQGHYAPRIPTTEPEFMKTLNAWAKKNMMKVPNSKVVPTISANIQATDDHNKIVKIMTQYMNLLMQYVEINKEVRRIAKETGKFKQMNKELSAGNLARECCCKFGDFTTLCQEIGNHIAVKTDGENETVINCTYEGEMINKYFHNISNCELFMSATLGNLNLYKEMIGLKDTPADQYKGLDIPSTFDFSKSPIWVSDKNPMSYAEKERSIGPICKQIAQICTLFKDKRGIIQTGNYENSKKLMERLPPAIRSRIILYGSAKEKNYAMSKYLASKDGILCGPTLLEGLNFDGDKCRFQICMKLPYASLANNLTKAKKDLIPDWYAGDTVAKLEQGFGRGIRYNGDYCETFILDGCIMSLLKYNSNLFSRVTRARFKKIP